MPNESRGHRRAWAAVGLLLAAMLGGCRATVVTIEPPAAPANFDPAGGVDWSGYADVLDACVGDDGLVDYLVLSQPPNCPRLLDCYAQLARVGPATAPGQFPDRDSKLAYYINAHNLLALVAMGPYFAPGKIDPRGVGDLPGPPESAFRFTVGGQPMTLAELRELRIAPLTADDPRPLLGLCAGRRNDPPLRREVYSADRLADQLADQLARVLAGNEWTTIDAYHRRLLIPAAISDHRAYYWAHHLGGSAGPVAGTDFLAVLLSLADARGRHRLNRAIGFDVVTAQPGDELNNRPVLPAMGE
ncbi:MAG: hypothetical protein BIFFINMI_02655 [Phycisphaerae bacterium]|nr:hypothetical protein [Phycisphaerae bacterium]